MTVTSDQGPDFLALVRADVLACFGEVLEAQPDREFHVELDGSTRDSESVVMRGDNLIAVPWVYPCVHSGDFLGYPPTYVAVDLRGVTCVDTTEGTERDGWKYHRYVDLLGALFQMGGAGTRQALTDAQFENWDNERRRRTPAS